MMKILIVDDEPANVALLQYILRSAGYKEVWTTTDSREAMKIFAEQEPDLLLLDLMMPHFSGFDLLEQLSRRISKEDCLPVLVLTADVSSDTKYQALQAGASDFLTKPFDHVEVLLRIRHLLQIRVQHRELAARRDTLEETVAERTGELRLACDQLQDTLGELRAAQQRMIQQERMSALGAMATGLAHDFNNSLSLILGYSELLQTDLMDTPYETRSDEYLGTIITAAQDASKMFNRLRTFSRSQDPDDHRTELDLNALVEQTASLTRPRWHSQALGAGATVELVLEAAPGLPLLLADAGELREGLTNLIFNAVDAMPQGGTLTLRTRYESGEDKAGEVLVLEVADTGVGMSEETRRRCLEPFYTTKGERGTGLGLAMVYGTVQRHGGTIRLHSAPGEGTRFELRLPLSEKPAADASEWVPTGIQLSRRILVVDDQPVLAEILCRYLLRDGHTCESAANAAEALEKFRAPGESGFDLVITDKVMPGMGGEDLALAIKALAPNVPVILVSGFSEFDEDLTSPPPAVDLSLVKPLTQNALRKAIHDVTQARPSVAAAPPAPVSVSKVRTRRIPGTRVVQSRLRLTSRPG